MITNNTLAGGIWGTTPKPTVPSFALQAALPLAIAAVGAFSVAMAGHSTYAQNWQGAFKSPATAVAWGSGAGQHALRQSTLLFPAVREFLNLTSQVSPQAVQAIHDSILQAFPAASISYSTYVDSFTEQIGLRFSVQSGIDDFEELYGREIVFFERMPSFLRDTLKYSIISID